MERAVNALPWTAAISFGAGVCATVVALLSPSIYAPYTHDALSAFRKAFPGMLGMNMLIWLPVALWARSDLAWKVIGTALAGVVLLLLIADPFSPKQYVDGGVRLLRALDFILVALCFGVCSLPTSALILVLSGERSAIRKGTWISELPYLGLRIGLLLLLTLLPLVGYALLKGR